MTLEELKNNGIGFNSTGDSFYSPAINLASGLNQLGIPIHANIDYRNPGISSLTFTKSEALHDCKVHVLDVLEGTFQDDFPYSIGSGSLSLHVYTLCDSIDHLNLRGDFTSIHRGHSNRFISSHYPFFPICFGVSDVLQNFSQNFEYGIRDEVVLRNFRYSRNQYVRLAMDLAWVKLLEPHIRIDRSMTKSSGRWDTAFYEKLGQSLGCLCYGGNLVEDLSDYYLDNLSLNDPRRDFLGNKKHHVNPAIVRWDSWRFWESLSMGCLSIHLDFEKHGFLLPEIPENWEHYVGISFNTLKEDLERLMDERSRWAEIAWNGRKWALEHYSPLPVAKRFLRNIGVDL